jgi:hypothetical protein
MPDGSHGYRFLAHEQTRGQIERLYDTNLQRVGDWTTTTVAANG